MVSGPEASDRDPDGPRSRGLLYPPQQVYIRCPGPVGHPPVTQAELFNNSECHLMEVVPLTVDEECVTLARSCWPAYVVPLMLTTSYWPAPIGPLIRLLWRHVAFLLRKDHSAR